MVANFLDELIVVKAQPDDLEGLVKIEQECFEYDRLSKRRFKHWLTAANGILLVVKRAGTLLGYGLVLLHKGTRLARLYSIALAPAARGRGAAGVLLAELESRAAQAKRLFMRLEVAKNNQSAIALYKSVGYRVFGEYNDYYEDHSDALRMQKRIRDVAVLASTAIAGYKDVAWFKQNTEFTCGPAALIMAMSCLSAPVESGTPASSRAALPFFNQETELDIWREATTIFMTSGHGGCHPVGLALAAKRRGYWATVLVNTPMPLFVDGVRNGHKKQVMTVVDGQFKERAESAGVSVVYEEVSLDHIQFWLQNDFAVIVLISTYRLDGCKAPHWVTVTAMDDVCLYVHDPDLDEKHQVPMDCQYIPIAKDDFVKMQRFGSQKLRTAVAIKRVDRTGA